VFGVHGAITLAGAVVLVVFPTAIPSAVGITITRPDYLLVYLVAAAELAFAVLSFGAIRITDWAALRLIVTTLVVLHAASGILDIVYMALTEANATSSTASVRARRVQRIEAGAGDSGRVLNRISSRENRINSEA